MRLPLGFRAAGISAGLKHSGRPDLGLVLGDGPLAWALVSTRSRVRAACVDHNRERHEAGGAVRALVVNSGNANCANGERGARDDRAYAAATAELLGLGPEEVLTASTGVVGQPLPIDRITANLPGLAAALEERSTAFATAIRTTDTTTKQVTLELPGGARVTGVAKGSGMIHPNMATMLAFVMTDADVAQERLRVLWPAIAARTFNQVTVDGDTSPNDMAVVLASGRVAVSESELEAALERVCRELARMIARDGEGATKLITVEVRGGASAADARAAARTVCRSPLVKAAVHGNDPNWGRILVALGYSGAEFDPARVRIALQGCEVYRGASVPFDAAAVSGVLADAEEVRIEVDLGAGEGCGTAWGCDLTRDYVRINADYTT